MESTLSKPPQITYIKLPDADVKITPKDSYYEIDISIPGEDRTIYQTISFDPENPRYINGVSSISEIEIMSRGLSLERFLDLLKLEISFDINEGEVVYSKVDGGYNIRILNEDGQIQAITTITFDPEVAEQNPNTQDFSQFINIEEVLQNISNRSLIGVLYFFLPKPWADKEELLEIDKLMPEENDLMTIENFGQLFDYEFLFREGHIEFEMQDSDLIVARFNGELTFSLTKSQYIELFNFVISSMSTEEVMQKLIEMGLIKPLEG